MDAWQRQQSLARATTAWAAASVGGGGLLLTRRSSWWRSFGSQTLGWGVVDLAIVGVADRLQHRRMRRLPDPYAPATLEREHRRLRLILAVNAVADAGYCVLGVVLWRRPDPRASGAGAAIVFQGAFLLLHDSHHAARSTVR